jgi:adenylate cyclase
VTAAALICASCGAELRENNKFCHQCGARITLLPEPAEYKQVTVLFANVVRSMDIARRGGYGPVARNHDRAHRALGSGGASLRGHVEYNGDGVMALFGDPVALEDYAFCGCLAARAI